MKTGQLNYVVIIVRNFQLAVIIKPAVGKSNFKFNMLNTKPYQSLLEPVVKLNFLHIGLIIFVLYIYIYTENFTLMEDKRATNYAAKRF